MIDSALKSLEKRNSSLKSRLLHEKLRQGEIPLTYFKKYSLKILNEYKYSGSIFKSSKNVGINPNVVMNWYVQGQLGNPRFRGFYLLIEKINNDSEFKINDDFPEADIADSVSEDIPENVDGDYVISEYGDGWSYKTYVDGEKVFIISEDLETLKGKVRNRHLPLD
jgi:hypothetical protein